MAPVIGNQQIDIHRFTSHHCLSCICSSRAGGNLLLLHTLECYLHRKAVLQHPGALQYPIVRQLHVHERRVKLLRELIIVGLDASHEEHIGGFQFGHQRLELLAELSGDGAEGRLAGRLMRGSGGPM